MERSLRAAVCRLFTLPLLLRDSFFRSVRIHTLASGRATMGVPEAQKPLLLYWHPIDPHPHRHYISLPYSHSYSIQSIERSSKPLLHVEWNTVSKGRIINGMSIQLTSYLNSKLCCDWGCTMRGRLQILSV